MKEQSEKRFITPTEALELITQGDYVHTFRNPAGILLGANISRSRLQELFALHPNTIEVAGGAARTMEHGIVVTDDMGPLFIETDMAKLNIFDVTESQTEN